MSSRATVNKSNLFDELEKGIQATLYLNTVLLVISTFCATLKPCKTQCCPNICTSKVACAILTQSHKPIMLYNCALDLLLTLVYKPIHTKTQKVKWKVKHLGLDVLYQIEYRLNWMVGTSFLLWLFLKYTLFIHFQWNWSFPVLH